jgi:hypothetical protein
LEDTPWLVMINCVKNWWWLINFEFVAVVSFWSVLANFEFWHITTNLISNFFLFFWIQKHTNPILYHYDNIRNCLFPLLFFLLCLHKFSLNWCCHFFLFISIYISALCIRIDCRSQWPCSLRFRSTAACLLWSWVRIPPEAWMLVSCVCCVLSCRGLCDGQITHSELHGGNPWTCDSCSAIDS